MNKVYIVVAQWDIVGDSTDCNVIAVYHNKRRAQQRLIKEVHKVQAENETECKDSPKVTTTNTSHWYHCCDDFLYQIDVVEQEVID